jgi:hypothetical protein
MSDVHAEINDLMGSVLNLLTERRDDAEITFSTFLCICVDIALANDMSRMEFMAFCMEMYRARSTPDGKVVH